MNSGSWAREAEELAGRCTLAAHFQSTLFSFTRVFLVSFAAIFGLYDLAIFASCRESSALLSGGG
jgi:hypothetical protein